MKDGLIDLLSKEFPNCMSFISEIAEATIGFVGLGFSWSFSL